MSEFKSFEEISSAYPLDNKSNYYYVVGVTFCYVITEEDKKYAQASHPYGWEDKQEHKWLFYDIVGRIWYDCYIYDGTKWMLGIDSWDGIVAAEEPKWGIGRANNIRRTEFGVFHTLEEAEEYRKKKWDERLEF